MSFALGFAACQSKNCCGCAAKVDATKQTISFSEIGTTLMLCANMEYEEKILKALESVKAYKAAENGGVDLTDGNGKTLLQLKKQ